MFDAIVIGGGQAGLAASHHLGRRGIEHVVLERERIGESWRSQRWDSFALNTPNWMNRLPGETADVEPRDAFLSRDAYVAHLQAYADDGRLPVRTGTTVLRVAPHVTSGTFIVSIEGAGGSAELEARNIVVASGIQRIPKIPGVAASLPTGVRQLHVADYRSPSALPPGAVLVVGSAQSGVQITEDLLDAGRTVYLCTSAVARLRRRYRGRDTLEWLLKGGFLDQTLERLPDPRLQFAPLPITSGVGRYGHTVSLQWLAARGAILLGRPVAVEGDRILLEDTLAANVAFGDRMSAEFNAGVEKGIHEAGLEPPALERDPADTPHPDPTSLHSPAEFDLDAAAVGSIIWATGFTGEFGYLPAAVLDAKGLPVHTKGSGPVPGLFFLGFPWLTRRRSGIISGVDDDAAMISERIAAQLAEG